MNKFFKRKMKQRVDAGLQAEKSELDAQFFVIFVGKALALKQIFK